MPKLLGIFHEQNKSKWIDGIQTPLLQRKGSTLILKYRTIIKTIMRIIKREEYNYQLILILNEYIYLVRFFNVSLAVTGFANTLAAPMRNLVLSDST